jgi:peroxiredoxin
MYNKLLLSLSAAVLLATACVREENDGPKIGVGDPVPAFKCETIDGDEFDSRDFRGKPTVLIFFNTDCRDCKDELPEIQHFREACEGDVARLMLVGRDETRERILSYWKEKALTLPACAGNGRVEYNLFAHSGIPRIFIYDKDGVVQLTYGPEDRPAANEILSFIETLTK